MSGPDKSRTSGSVRKVKPQLMNDKTAVESFMDFFQGTFQAYGNTSHEGKERIVWARVVATEKEYSNNCSPFDSSLLLILGYVNGVQIWKMMGNGDAEEVVSVREGAVRAICMLNPIFRQDAVDPYLDHRPLIVMATTVVNSGNVFSAASIRSLRTGSKLKSLEFDVEVIDMFQTPHFLLITVIGAIHVYDVYTFEPMFVVNDCFHGLGLNANPIAFGTRWLAYSPDSPLPELQSVGGLAINDDQSYTETVVSAAQTITSATSRGIQIITGGVNWLASKSSLAGNQHSPGSSPSQYTGEIYRPRNGSVSSADSYHVDRAHQESTTAGLVTILDLERIVNVLKNENDNEKLVATVIRPSAENVVAHFTAHSNFALACMTFSPCGRLLATSDTRGHSFNVYSIFTHPQDSRRTAVHHLYTLWRGDTFSKVQELRFSWDCRWLCASTLRGTCHIFPITPYGGRPTVRTHTSKRTVSRLSTYCKSAGIDEIEYMESLQSNMSKLSANDLANVSRSFGWQDSRQHRMLASRAAHYNPRLMPFLPPTELKALAHVRVASSSVITNTLPGMLSGQASFTVPTNDQPPPNVAKPATKEGDVVMATYFVPNPWVDRRPGSMTSNPDTDRGGIQRLLVLSSNGFLTEYSIQPRCLRSLQVAKEDSPIEVETCSTVCWNLQRSTLWKDLPLDLPPSNPLIEAADAIKLRYSLHGKQQQQKNGSNKNNEEGSYDESGLLDGGDKAAVKTEQPKSYMEKRTVSAETDHDERGESRVAVHPEWQSQVEKDTHDGPTRRLWMGPQFSFVPLGTPAATKPLSSESSSVLTHGRHDEDGYMTRDFSVDDADTLYTDISGGISRSAPMPTPTTRNCGRARGGEKDEYMSNYTIKVGSGTFDRVSTMLNINDYVDGDIDGQPLTDGGRVSRDCQMELQKRIADAINEPEGCNKKPTSIRTQVDNLNDQPEELLFSPDLSFPSKPRSDAAKV